jgi:transcriptional regulator with XRE-family HTH domain
MPFVDRNKQKAARRARRHLVTVADDFRSARFAAGVSQRVLASRVGLSQSRISRIERAAASNLRLVEAVQIAAALGLDLSVRTYPGGAPIRDAAHVDLIRRFRGVVSSRFRCQLEVPVSSPDDRRAIDVLLTLEGKRIGVEAEVRLTDIQALLRRLALKQQDAGLERMILLARATRSNRIVLREAASLLMLSFPLARRDLIKALRIGTVPAENGLLLM